MKFDTLADAYAYVANSGVVDWFNIGQLAPWLYRNANGESFNALLARFVREELDEDPADYGIPEGGEG